MAMPDFTDCSFASREPDTDWAAVIHGGGPARGFSELMPPHGEALSQAEVGQNFDAGPATASQIWLPVVLKRKQR